MSNLTKQAIRTSFWKLLDERPLSKITVKDITDACGINRNSFYYHYPDIPTLIQEILADEVQRIIGEYPTIDSIEDCFRVSVAFAMENKRAILHVYNSVNRDLFEQYLWQSCEESVKAYFSTVAAGVSLREEDTNYLIRYQTCELFGVISSWLRDGMRWDMAAFLHRMYELRRGTFQEMVRRCAGSDL